MRSITAKRWGHDYCSTAGGPQMSSGPYRDRQSAREPMERSRQPLTLRVGSASLVAFCAWLCEAAILPAPSIALGQRNSQGDR
jgi:hypothetical protein